MGYRRNDGEIVVVIAEQGRPVQGGGTTLALGVYSRSSIKATPHLYQRRRAVERSASTLQSRYPSLFPFLLSLRPQRRICGCKSEGWIVTAGKGRDWW